MQLGHCLTNDESKEKCSIGSLWEDKSDGRALFLMTVVENDKPGPRADRPVHRARVAALRWNWLPATLCRTFITQSRSDGQYVLVPLMRLVELP